MVGRGAVNACDIIAAAFLFDDIEEGTPDLNLSDFRSHNALPGDTIMRSYREELWFETTTRRAYINITPQVEQVVKKSGVREGLVLVNAMHITASVYINDDEQGLLQDYDRFLERIAPHDDVYRHNDTGEDNGDAHIKRQVMGREVVVAITNGRMDFGPWEQIFYGEFDGRRKKRVLVKVIGE
jgi:secondary thiamine-phosphate synthase enzyme